MTNDITMIVTRGWVLQSKSVRNDQKGAKIKSKKVPRASEET